MQLLGKTRIGSGCRIRSFSVIENCTLGNGVLIRQSCVLEDSTIADGAEIGPFAHLRPGSEIGENAHVGNFVEDQESAARQGRQGQPSHLSRRRGDRRRHQHRRRHHHLQLRRREQVPTRIGKGVFVGSDTTLVAPITIGDGAYIGAGSCITKDVPADALAVGRGRQITKEGWAAARRAQRERRNDSMSHAARQSRLSCSPILAASLLVFARDHRSRRRRNPQPPRSRKKSPTASGFFPATPPRATATTSSSR